MNLLSLLPGLVTALLGTDPAARGLEIARAADEADSGWKAERAVAEMTIETPRGMEHRKFRITTLDADPERTLVELLAPARHRGTRILTLSSASSGSADEVFVHFGRLGRTRRIVGRKRTGRFLGSELTFEDLGSRRHHRYSHRYLRTERLEDIPCHVVETVPKDADSGYARILLWRRTDDYRLMKVAWYDKAGNTLEKEGVFSEWKRFGTFFRPMKYVVTNTRTGRKTTLTFSERELGLDLDPGRFTPASFER